MSNRVPRSPAVAGGRWVTLTNRRRVFLGDDGRIRRGLPETFRNVHVHDVSNLGRRIRDTERDEGACEQAVHRRNPRTFRTTEEAVRALLEANPALVDFLEIECGRRSCEAYAAWVRRGRRGPRPLPTYNDGRFDAIDVPLDLRGKRRVSSWLDAVYRVVPASRQWEDFNDRLQYLADATGLRLALPGPAERVHVEATDVEQCRSVADQRIDELIQLARSARLPGAESNDEAVPF